MITEQGLVVAVQGDDVWVQTIRTSACQSCAARSGCGQRSLARLSAGRANQVRVANALSAAVGDRVTLGIEESAVLKASAVVYALPLITMLLGTLAGNALAPGGDSGALIGALAGLAGGFAVSRRAQRSAGLRAAPVLMAVESVGPVICR
ncbi:SoxR reducing system RseC family protein [Marinobacter sp. C2H3]|uniref:SoxR reducing system RseC family protein n=1 Tax=Marinobacter sp. C2H3 TaxID=3119003 RepID=UPI00300EAC66